MAKVNKTVSFKVRGKGVFPYDMLRYDRCFPKLESEIWVLNRCEIGEEREITVVMSGYNGHPTIARWQSFGWHVIDVTNHQY